MFSVIAADIDTYSGDVATLAGLEGLFANVVSAALVVAGIVLFVMLLIGGFNVLTAGTDAGKVQAGQKTITYAIFGLILIALSYLILVLISSFTGVEGILNFKIRN